LDPQEKSTDLVPGDDNIGADLRAAFDAVETAAPAEAGGEPAPTDTAAAPAAEGRARDEGGRFAKAPAKPEGAAAEAGKEGAPGATAAAPAAPAVEIPKNWPADVRAKLEKLAQTHPEMAHEWIRSTRYWEGMARTERERAAPFARLHQALEDVLAPTRQQRQLQGLDDAQFLRSLVAADGLLSRDPAAGIKWLAQRYGVSPEQLVEGVKAAQESAPAPEVRRLMDEVSQLKSYLGQMTQTAQQQALSGVVDQIEAFASAKGPDGSLLRPYFDDCIADIQILVEAQRSRGEPVDLQAAYDRAIRMNDAVWMRVQAQQAEKQAAERAQAAEKAKRAGFTVAGSGTSAASEEPADSIRGELERQLLKLSL
jgi:hypothetical protein